MSRPARALWIEIIKRKKRKNILRSRPARALWIEILSQSVIIKSIGVEAREGLVD